MVTRDQPNENWKFAAGQILKVAERRDRLVIGGAAGTLILSITFLHNIGLSPSTWSLVVLVASWGLLAGALWAAFDVQRQPHPRPDTARRGGSRQIAAVTEGGSRWNSDRWARVW